MSRINPSQDIPFAVDIHGVTYQNPCVDELGKILSSLNSIDDLEQNEVWVCLPKDVTLSFSSSGIMIWEEGEEIEKTLSDVSNEAAVEIWLAAIQGKWDLLNEYAWQDFN